MDRCYSNRLQQSLNAAPQMQPPIAAETAAVFKIASKIWFLGNIIEAIQ
jgi:hypothetical protein